MTIMFSHQRASDALGELMNKAIDDADIGIASTFIRRENRQY